MVKADMLRSSLFVCVWETVWRLGAQDVCTLGADFVSETKAAGALPPRSLKREGMILLKIAKAANTDNQQVTCDILTLVLQRTIFTYGSG
jgi:hypothetical protein